MSTSTTAPLMEPRPLFGGRIGRAWNSVLRFGVAVGAAIVDGWNWLVGKSILVLSRSAELSTRAGRATWRAGKSVVRRGAVFIWSLSTTGVALTLDLGYAVLLLAVGVVWAFVAPTLHVGASLVGTGRSVLSAGQKLFARQPDTGGVAPHGSDAAGAVRAPDYSELIRSRADEIEKRKVELQKQLEDDPADSRTLGRYQFLEYLGANYWALDPSQEVKALAAIQKSHKSGVKVKDLKYGFSSERDALIEQLGLNEILRGPRSGSAGL